MRSENSIRNVIVNLSSQIFGIVMSFICRTVFIQTLGKVYLGVDGLFGNLLSLFALAELGIGSTIIFHMYEPLARHDRKKIGALMTLFKKAYRTIGLVIGGVGLLFTPFYHFFVDKDIKVPNLTLIYLLYVFNSVITYFYSYKQCIITADQKGYICTLYQYAFCITQNILQILVLIYTRNFILYFSLQILFSFFTNFVLARKAGKMYPYLKKYEKEKLNQSDKAEIFRNMKAMFMHRFGGVIVNGTDSLIISKFFGIVYTGLYSNYFMIVNTINGLTSQIFNGITASVGNLGAVENNRKSYRIFKVTNFIGFWIFSFCSISLFCLLNPFIELWVGSKMLLPVSVVFFLVLNFYATGMRQATLTFKNSLGLFWYDRYKAVAEALINLICSLILAQKMGISGVFLGTLISIITTDLWVEPLVLYRHGFHRSVGPYFFRYIVYTILTFGTGYLTWYLCSLTGSVGFLSFAGRCFICLIVPNLIYLLLFWRSDEFQYLKRSIQMPAFLKRRLPKAFAGK